MGNIISYLDNFSNISFAEMPFNLVDNLVLCTLSYLQLQSIVPNNCKQTISIKEASKIFYENKNLNKLSELQVILLKMSAGKRFCNAQIFNYVNQFDIEKCMQFCAFHISLSDNTTFIAIRGTDASITGWQESFSLSYKTIPSQLAAADYLNSTIQDSRIYRIGGHSKGGNLAQYAALMCPPKLQAQIISIYSNDSPGVHNTFTDYDKYTAISNKIIRIVPEFSIVGSFFETEKPSLIVKTAKKGIVSHDALTWCVDYNHFLTCKCTILKSRLFSALFRLIINSLNFSQRKKFIDYCFLIIKNSGIKDMTKLNFKLIIKLTLKPKQYLSNSREQ